MREIRGTNSVLLAFNFKREGKGKKGDARVNLADLCPSSVYEAQLPGK